MKELTKQEAVENHRKMWNWISSETLKRKRKVTEKDYFNEVRLDDFLIEDSYCCEYDDQKHEFNESFCKHCPLVWESKVGEVMCINKYQIGDCEGLYIKWWDEIDYKRCAELAEKIANLSEK